jgi:hypothetical protein
MQEIFAHLLLPENGLYLKICGIKPLCKLFQSSIRACACSHVLTWCMKLWIGIDRLFDILNMPVNQSDTSQSCKLVITAGKLRLAFTHCVHQSCL